MDSVLRTRRAARQDDLLFVPRPRLFVKVAQGPVILGLEQEEIHHEVSIHMERAALVVCLDMVGAHLVIEVLELWQVAGRHKGLGHKCS